MDFGFSDEGQALREEIRAFVAQHLPAELSDELYKSGDSHNDAFVAAIGEKNWIVPEWERDGYEVLGKEAVHIINDELTKVDAPIYASATGAMVANVIRQVGGPELQPIVDQVVAGEVTIALGMSEPEAGSDVATVQTKARLADPNAPFGGWIVDGQKMFTTNAHLCEYVFLLARTDPDSKRHRGLTTFLLPMDLPGIEVQRVTTISGERTNITFYADVFVEDKWRISDVGAGWGSLMVALQDEHSAAFSPHLARALEHAEHWAKEADAAGSVPMERDPIRRALIEAATDLEVAELLELRTTWMEEVGQVPISEGPMSKLFSTESIVKHGEAITAAVGPDALRSRLDPTAIGHGHIEHILRFSLGSTIYAGSSEVQRNLIAQHRCGLPRG